MKKNIIEIDEASARKHYHTAPEFWKNALENTFGKDFFSKKLIERVFDWDGVCAEKGIHPASSLPHPNPINADQISDNGFFKMKRIQEVFNGGVVMDFDNPRQEKWYIIWKKTGSGFVVSHTCTFSFFDLSNTTVGPRLCYINNPTAQHIGKYFHKEFNEMFAI